VAATSIIRTSVPSAAGSGSTSWFWLAVIRFMPSKIKVVLSSLFILLFALSCGNVDRWEVLCARYGVSEGMPLSKMVRGGSDEKYPMAWMFWILRSKGKTILVDCGFENEQMKKKWKIEKYKRPVDILLDLNIKPEDVTDVILTHLHWDHAGSIARFKNAKIWLQKNEWNWARKMVSEDQRYSNGINYDDVVELEKIAKEGRLVLLNGDKKIYSGVHVVTGGCHTMGFQWVWVETMAGNIVIASDAAYLYENLDGPTPLACKKWSDSVRTLGKMLSIAKAKEQVLPGHEPKVYDIFPKLNDYIVQVTPPVAQK